MKSAEQEARDLLERMEIEGAQSFSAGELVELANLIAAQDPNLSNITINGERQTWEQMYQREHTERLRLQAYQTMLTDLDRCEHGRHQGDVCGNCPSEGNPHLKTGDVIGYSLGGSWKYVVPEPRLRGDIHHWRVLAREL